MSAAKVKRNSTSDLMDDWLESQGYYRKHIAKDSSCLFRAVSEQLFNTQVLHSEIRTKCADFMEFNSTKFATLTDDSFENRISVTRNPKEWGGHIEILAMSSIYKCDFNVFQDVGKSLYKVTNNNYDTIVLLCQTSGNHYDSVYPKSFIQTAAISQSIVYEILYKKVFALGDEVDFAVETMLHDKVYAKSRKDSATSVDSNPPLPVLDCEESGDDKDSKEVGSEIRAALARGFPPFPYKVAKALDPDIYRNVEFDVWNESKKGEIVYEPGVKCLVRLDKDKPETYHAHIQEMLPDLGSVTLYIVELGKKQTVAIECLEPLPNHKSYPSHGSPTEFDNYKGKKKLYKKNKFKELQFSVSIPRGKTGQPIPPRFQPQQQQQINNHNTSYNNSVNLIGREREIPYQGINNSSPNYKWISTVTQANRYRNKNSDKFTNLAYSPNDTHNYKVPTHFSRSGEKTISISNSAATPLTWAKSNGSMTSTRNSRSGSIDDDRCSELASGNGHHNGKREETCPDLTINNIPSVSNCATPDLSKSNLTTIPSVSNQQFPTQDSTLVSSPILTSPQPFTLYPCQYFGVCLPYESPMQSVNYGTPRSRDPQGNDLPLHDLATLRFFYNLGHDYFRSASIIPMPNHQYHSVWNCSPQIAYQTVGGYGTPASSVGNESESMTESSLSTGVSSTPNDNVANIISDENGVKEFYESTYLYDVPTMFQPQQMDYNVPYQAAVHSVTGEFKGGLVVNEQGVLTLNESPPAPTRIHNSHSNQQPHYQQPTYPTRFRTDSGSFNRSHRNGSGNWYKNMHKNANSRANYNDSNNITTNQPVYSSPKKDSTSCSQNPWSQRYQNRVPGCKQNASSYAGHHPPANHQPSPHPTMIPMTAQPSPTFPMMQAGSPIMTTASPTSMGVFTSLGGHGSPTYYGSQPTIIYPQPHLPQPISYMATTAL